MSSGQAHLTEVRPPAPSPRATLSVAGTGEQTEVVLARGDRQASWTESVNPADGASGALYAAAAATLGALTTLVDESLKFRLDWVRMSEPDHADLPMFVTVIASCDDDRGGTAQYVGSAFVGRDPRAAAAKAALDAVNRRVAAVAPTP